MSHASNERNMIRVKELLLKYESSKWARNIYMRFCGKGENETAQYIQMRNSRFNWIDKVVMTIECSFTVHLNHCSVLLPLEGVTKFLIASIRTLIAPAGYFLCVQSKKLIRRRVKSHTRREIKATSPVLRIYEGGEITFIPLYQETLLLLRHSKRFLESH